MSIVLLKHLLKKTISINLLSKRVKNLNQVNLKQSIKRQTKSEQAALENKTKMTNNQVVFFLKPKRANDLMV